MGRTVADAAAVRAATHGPVRTVDTRRRAGAYDLSVMMMSEDDACIESAFLATLEHAPTPELREAHALGTLFPRIFAMPTPGDRFVGRVRSLPFGVDLRRGGYVFTAGHPTTHDRVLAACSPSLRRLVSGERGLRARTGWRGFVLDYDTLLKQGLPGLHVGVDARRTTAHAPRAAWDGMLAAIAVLQHSAEHLTHSATAVGLADAADALTAIAVHPPRTLFEALQLLLLFLAHTGFPEQLGRMDVYLGDVYADDLHAGRITPEEAERMLADFLRLCAEGRGAPSRVTVGGRGRRNPAHADAAAALIAAVADRQLGYTVALDVRRSADTKLTTSRCAVLHDDDTLIPLIAQDFGVAFNIAERYVPLGDATYSLGHAGCHASTCTLDLSAVPSDVTAQELVEAAADYHALACDVTGADAPCLLPSLLLDGCIARGETVFTGGMRFLGGALLVRGADADARRTLRAIARDQSARTWLHAYVCGWE
jgi:hypothetical protein